MKDPTYKAHIFRGAKDKHFPKFTLEGAQRPLQGGKRLRQDLAAEDGEV